MSDAVCCFARPMAACCFERRLQFVGKGQKIEKMAANMHFLLQTTLVLILLQ